MRAAEISRSGMDVEWQRLQVIANNLANMNTARTASGGPFQPMRLVSAPRAGFGELLNSNAPAGARVAAVEAMPGSVRRVHEPGNPFADAEGFVTYPDIDQSGEMTLLIRASRAYEANLAAMSIAHQMYSRALDLGRTG
jgi:flagellar basal-body rod protein FlgC